MVAPLTPLSCTSVCMCLRIHHFSRELFSFLTGDQVSIRSSLRKRHFDQELFSFLYEFPGNPVKKDISTRSFSPFRREDLVETWSSVKKEDFLESNSPFCVETARFQSKRTFLPGRIVLFDRIARNGPSFATKRTKAFEKIVLFDRM